MEGGGGGGGGGVGGGGGGGGGGRGEREAYLKNAKITPDLQHYEEKRVDTADNLEEMSHLSE